VVVAQNAPYEFQVVKDQRYSWCTCGRSAKQVRNSFRLSCGLPQLTRCHFVFSPSTAQNTIASL